MANAVQRLADHLAYWTGIAVMILVAAFTLFVSFAVVLRYGFSLGLEWSEELGRYLMIWMGFLAASLAVRSGGHIGIDLVRNLLPARLRRLVVLGASLAVIAFLGMLVYQSIPLLRLVDAKESLVLPVSMFWPYLAVPVGCALMIVQLVAVALRDWKAGATREPRTTGGELS